MRRVHTRDSSQSRRTCESCCRTARSGSRISINDPRVQDAYSLRCMPQVHGAIRTALSHARQVVEIESGSATDNPLVFSETGEVLSGGNFHGAPLALVFDYAAIALTDLMSITERRIDRLVNPDSNEGLPPFLTAHPGISSGFMMLQVTAVALLNEAKVLAHPASIDNVPTDGGKEDHVSMGMTVGDEAARDREAGGAGDGDRVDGGGAGVGVSCAARTRTRREAGVRNRAQAGGAADAGSLDGGDIERIREAISCG